MSQPEQREHIEDGSRCWCKDRMKIDLPESFPIRLGGEDVGTGKLDEHGRLEVKLDDSRATELLAQGRLHSVSLSSDGFGSLLVEGCLEKEQENDLNEPGLSGR